MGNIHKTGLGVGGRPPACRLAVRAGEHTPQVYALQELTTTIIDPPSCQVQNIPLSWKNFPLFYPSLSLSEYDRPSPLSSPSPSLLSLLWGLGDHWSYFRGSLVCHAGTIRSSTRKGAPSTGRVSPLIKVVPNFLAELSGGESTRSGGPHTHFRVAGGGTNIPRASGRCLIFWRDSANLPSFASLVRAIHPAYSGARVAKISPG